MLRSIAKSALRPLWRPLRHRLEHIVRSQVAPVESVVLEQGSRLDVLLDRLNAAVLARHGKRAVDPVQLYPFPHTEDECQPDTILHGFCPVCGQPASFSPFTSNLRESGPCSCCSSFNRQRQMARAVRLRFGVPDQGPLTVPAGTVIYNTETTGAVHAALRATPGYLSSEYFDPALAPGTMVDGRRHEDLQHLSFDDESIDLVLSSDVLEHMPAPYDAHCEIFRVLRPGGSHIFTVPFIPDQPRDDVRAELIDGEIAYRAPQLFHGDPVRPDEGVLVWTIFGMEMLLKLRELGFEVCARNLHAPEMGILGDMPIVFEATKPERSTRSERPS